MRKHLQTLALGAGLLLSTGAGAQTAVGTVVGNFTLTDINGNPQDLYSYLDAGKMVVIDISAIWCSPCWAYHGTNALEDFYAAHGPAGADDAMVLFIEGDVSTSTPCLYNASSGCVGGPSQGDWVTGATHPIIDLQSADAASFPLQIPYFPCMYVICPSRIVYQSGVAGAIGTLANLNSYVGECPVQTTMLDAGAYSTSDMNQNLLGCDSIPVQCRILNYGSTTLTSADIDVKVDGVTQKTVHWTGSLATYANAIVPTSVMGKIYASGAGSHTLSFATKNPNASTDGVPANDNGNTVSFTILPATGGAPVAEPFTSSTYPPSGWSIIDGGSTDYTWMHATSVTQIDGTSGGASVIPFYGISSGDVDEFIIKGVDLSGSSTGALTFDVSHKQYASGYNDNLKVYISSNCGSTWNQIYSKSGASLASVTGYTGNTEWNPSAGSDWRHESVNISPYTGSGHTNVMLKFTAISGYGNDLYVDNININNASVSAVNEINNNFNINVYPNPANDMINVALDLDKNTNVKIEVRNSLGQVIQLVNQNDLAAGSHKISVALPEVPAGIYFVQVTANGSSTTHKITVAK